VKAHQVVGSVGLVCLLVAAGTASAAPPRPKLRDVSVRQLTHVAPDYRAGEPWGAVNPRDPDNIVIFDAEVDNASGSIDRGDPVVHPDGASHAFFTRCGVSVTFDRGRTWTFRDVSAPGVAPYACADPSVFADRHGNFYVDYGYVGADGTVGFADAGAENQVRESRDGGRTWGPPTAAFGSTQTAQNVQQGNAYPLCTAADRPWLALDDNSGTLYVTGNADGVNPCDANAVLGEGQGRYIVASHDHGRTWTLPAPSGQGQQTAAFGTVAITNAADTAWTFKLSRDDGRHWTRRPVPVVDARVTVNPLWPGLSQLDAPKTAADPTRRGHYAVLVIAHAATQLDVYVTGDYGMHWSRQRVVRGGAAPIAYPAIAFGPRGDLGLSWRSSKTDGSYDVFGAVSTDGGRQFSVPTKLTPTSSRGPTSTGDDCHCFVVVDGRDLITAWGDYRSGTREVWWGRARYR
jgi:hypothetical protein